MGIRIDLSLKGREQETPVVGYASVAEGIRLAILPKSFLKHL